MYQLCPPGILITQWNLVMPINVQRANHAEDKHVKRPRCMLSIIMILLSVRLLWFLSKADTYVVMIILKVTCLEKSDPVVRRLGFTPFMKVT